MTLSEKDIRHIASLAKLELTDKEVKQYRAELGGIVRYVDQLQTIKLKKITHHSINNSSHYLRTDTVQPWDEKEREMALKQAPIRQGRLVKVKRILA